MLYQKMSMTESTTFRMRGVSEVWGRKFHANTTFFRASCTITPDAITVRALGWEHVHPKSDMTELRWIRFPIPYFIVISRTADEVRYSSFQMLRWWRLRAKLKSAGYSFTEERRYYSIHEIRDDVRRYDLIDQVPT